MCVMSPSAGTGAGGLHVELPNEKHRVYMLNMRVKTGRASSYDYDFSYSPTPPPPNYAAPYGSRSRTKG
jgi:hypothetical protein